MRFWPESLVWRLTLWAFLLFLVSIPILWVAFLKGAERISENVVDTQILDFATQLRGYRASAVNAAAISNPLAGFSVSMPILVGDTDWVWQFSSRGEVEARSDLLQLSDLILPLELAPEAETFLLQNVETPVGPMRVAGRAINEAPNGEAPKIVRYIVGLNENRYQDRVGEHAARLRELVFVAVLPISVGILGMLIFVVLTLRGTFAGLKTAIERYESTGAPEIEGRFPHEIQTLVDRTNAILRQNQLLIERTRKYVSKIAHDINHPLAILKNAIRSDLDPEQVNRQIERMSGLIDRYASLARAIGPESQARGAIEIAPVLEDIADGFEIMYRRTPLKITYSCPPTLKAVIPRHDLETVISNLVSNAQKYAESETLITATGARQKLQITVEDDGPGILLKNRKAALNWGNRLDEAPPGTGFGLSIVCDIVDLYAGKVSLDESERLGGLKVAIDLPVPVTTEDANGD